MTYGNRGIAYYYDGNYKAAINSMAEAIELEPNDDAAFNNQGVVLEALGEPEKAMIMYDGALKVNPKNETAIENKRNLTASGGKPSGVKGKLGFWNPRKVESPYVLRRGGGRLPTTYEKVEERITPPAEITFQEGTPQGGAGIQVPKTRTGEWISNIPGRGFVLRMLIGKGDQPLDSDTDGPFTFCYDVVMKLVEEGGSTSGGVHWEVPPTVTGTIERTLRNVFINPGWSDEPFVKSEYSHWEARIGTTITNSIRSVLYQGTLIGYQIGDATYPIYRLDFNGYDALNGVTTYNSAGIKYRATFDLRRK
jgi:tetratricopeptide (TPR) repeat protein